MIRHKSQWTLAKTVVTCIVVFSSQFSFSENPPTNADELKPKVSFQKVRPGDTLVALLGRFGFDANQRTKILQQKVFSENFTLIPGEKFRVSRDDKQKFAELKFYEIPSNNVLLFWRKGNDAGSLSRNESYKIKVKTARGHIDGSILASINAHTKDDFVAQRFMDAYALDYKLTKEVQRGAKFVVTYEEKYDDDQFIGTGEVIETELEIHGKVEKRRFVPHSDGGSFISDSLIHKNRPLYSPVNYMRITSHYNRRRFHPITKRRTPHLGVDFELPEGEDLFATSAGKVLRKGKNRAAGYYVVLRHDNGLESYYNHLQSIDSSVKQGGYVKTGQIVGKVGCTGYCTKPHLHFALKKRGQFVDPIPYIKSYPYVKKSLIRRHIAALGRQDDEPKTSHH